MAEWPKLFLVYSMNWAENRGLVAQGGLIRAYEGEYEDVQDFTEKWFEDPSVLRIYELRQCYAVGKFRGQ